jgi:hypothetical protein
MPIPSLISLLSNHEFRKWLENVIVTQYNKCSHEECILRKKQEVCGEGLLSYKCIDCKDWDDIYEVFLLMLKDNNPILLEQFIQKKYLNEYNIQDQKVPDHIIKMYWHRTNPCHTPACNRENPCNICNKQIIDLCCYEVDDDIYG